MRPLLASLFDGLDGVTYFFVSSGTFVLVTAGLFFTIGLWMGGLAWGRYKRRFRASQETIEELKNEVAQLKRRTAELAARTFPPHGGHMPAVSRSPLAALVQSASRLLQPPPSPSPPPPGAPFSVWTEPGWEPSPVSSPPLPPSAASSLWPPPEPAVELVAVSDHANTATAGGESLHFTIDHKPHRKHRKPPKSRAFTLWTEPGLEPPAIAPAA